MSQTPETCKTMKPVQNCIGFIVLYVSGKIAQVLWIVCFRQNCTGFKFCTSQAKIAQVSLFCTFQAKLHRCQISYVSGIIAQVSLFCTFQPQLHRFRYFVLFRQNCTGFVFYTFHAIVLTSFKRHSILLLRGKTI